MYAREWSCLCPLGRREGFLQHLERTGAAEVEAIPGCLGHQVLEAEAAAGFTQILFVSYWSSMEAIEAFAGEATEVAVLYPGDEVYEIIPETVVRHRKVLKQWFRQTPPSAEPRG